MIAIKRYSLSIVLLLTAAFPVSAQKDPQLKPSRTTVLFQEYVDKEQMNALKSDGKEDKIFSASDNEEINFFLTNALITKIDQLQLQIENDTSLGGQAKVRYIRGLEYLLKDLNANWKSRQFAVNRLPAMLTVFEACMEQDKKNRSIEFIINEQHHDVGKPVVYCRAFDNNPGYTISRNIIIRKYCALYPDQTFPTLMQHYSFKQNPEIPFVDSLIKVAGYAYPRQLYDYAAASNKLSAIIRQINDPLVQSVVKMATSGGSGQLYFPFLDNIVKGKLTISDIDAVRTDSIKYYKLLVKTHLDYVARAVNKDTAKGYADLEFMLQKKAQSVFVNTINALHDLDAVPRFRIIQSLTAQELYYLAVMSDGIIYTSSYTKGVFPLMMSRVNNNGDSLLRLVMFDRYRKFIKMAAGYNTLSTFLGTFPVRENASILMRAFVGNLEKSGGLEDGVDVADSYASIAETIRPVADEMLLNVRLNYQRNVAQNNKKGIEIYRILEKLFLSADTSKNIDLAKELGIPPVYSVPYTGLANDSGRVIMQVFFYGEKSDMGIFNDFVSMYRNANWSMVSNDKWVSFHSLKGRPVSIYANRALPQEGGEDEKAQKELGEYLVKNKIYPTVTIHRGHSYTAPYTIEQMAPTSKIVFLGSCGGYHLIHDVLAKAPDAHIIASKQIGRTVINRPFFRLLTEKTRNGSNIDWIPFWKEFKNEANVPEFEDYIPPYKNLGAIFIKAYKIAMGDSEPALAAAKKVPVSSR